MRMSYFGVKAHQAVLRGDFRAGEGNQLLVIQKMICLAVAVHAKITTPVLFHCDRTTVPEACNETAVFPLTDVFKVSDWAHQLFTDRPATRIIRQAFYIKDRCVGGSAEGFPDLAGFSDAVKAYGESLRAQCPPPCMVLQHRSGKDWVPHAKAFPAANVSATVLKLALRPYAGYNQLLLAPERLSSELSIARIRHDSTVHPTIRFLGEVYVASHAKAFIYNPMSTTRHLVKRFAAPGLTMVKLR